MDYKTLIDGYKEVLNTIYSPKQYYERVKIFLKEYKPLRAKAFHPQFGHLRAFARSVWFLGIKEKGRKYYWRLLTWTLLRRPRSFPVSVTFAIYGFHFRKVVKGYIGVSVLK
jgi:hypothetical protein